MRTTFYKSVSEALRLAGFELIRKNNSHDIFRKSKHGNIVVPRSLDDRNVVRQIYRRAGLTL